MTQVWRLNKIPQKSNAHSIGFLSETWSWSKDKKFDTREDAEEYVIEQNVVHSGYELRLHEESDDVIRKRCLLNTDLSSYWVCFLDMDSKTDRKAMRELILKQLQDRKIYIRQ